MRKGGLDWYFLFVPFLYRLPSDGRVLCYSCIVLVHRCRLQYISLLPIMLLFLLSMYQCLCLCPAGTTHLDDLASVLLVPAQDRP